MRRKLVQVLAPLVAILTLMVGLRVGAKDAVRAATISGAPLANRAPGEPPRLAWQVLTFLEDRGVREAVSIPKLTVVARSRGGEARWTGESNGDGIAEPSLALAGLREGDPLELEVRADGEPTPLARGSAVWRDVPWARAVEDGGSMPAVRPSRREGALRLDVLVESGRLVPGFPSTLWVRVTPKGPGPVRVTIAPEPGLTVEHAEVVACDDGWAELTVTARAHVVGATIRAEAQGPAGAPPSEGEWFGALPVAPGAFYVRAPRVVAAGAPMSADLVAPNPRTVVYAEVDDERGRAAAAALKVAADPAQPVPHARFDVPGLAPGLHWLVVSGEPRGAEHLRGAAVAKPFFVSATPGERDACDVGPTLAKSPAERFPRWVALDGFPERDARNRSRRLAGLLIAAVALVAAALVEVLILVGAAREAKAALARAEAEAAGDGQVLTARAPGGTLAVALLLAVLGFALLGALLLAKA